MLHSRQAGTQSSAEAVVSGLCDYVRRGSVSPQGPPRGLCLTQIADYQSATCYHPPAPLTLSPHTQTRL